ncbi:hypothetical protein [Paraburkholderia sp. Ac-20347]|jgi:hypothetical protein|nr:hypothetical protein [Paraburkholderia sp. Ac-20347]MBN3812475.1 hypothetical protein [Paraburkholderia sp. Ac-20347]
MKKIERVQLAEIKAAGGCCKGCCAPRRVVSTPVSSGSSGGSGGSPVPR